MQAETNFSHNIFDCLLTEDEKKNSLIQMLQDEHELAVADMVAKPVPFNEPLMKKALKDNRIDHVKVMQNPKTRRR